MTIKDILGDVTKAKVGVRIAHHAWRDEEWFEPYFKSNYGIWYGLDELGTGEEFHEDEEGFYLWIPEKKKIKLYKWATRSCLGSWTETNCFYKEGELPFTNPDIIMKRLDYTCIEVDE